MSNQLSFESTQKENSKKYFFNTNIKMILDFLYYIKWRPCFNKCPLFGVIKWEKRQANKLTSYIKKSLRSTDLKNSTLCSKVCLKFSQLCSWSNNKYHPKKYPYLKVHTYSKVVESCPLFQNLLNWNAKQFQWITKNLHPSLNLTSQVKWVRRKN